MVRGSFDLFNWTRAIEISPTYRHLHLGGELIATSLSADEFEDYIVLTTEYYWHWDLDQAQLDVFEYKKLMQKLMSKGGLEIFATDDPEITSHPANCLMARIGKRITLSQQQAFDNLRYKNKFFFWHTTKVSNFKSIIVKYLAFK